MPGLCKYGHNYRKYYHIYFLIMLNDHSNPYIESTTDYYAYNARAIPEKTGPRVRPVYVRNQGRNTQRRKYGKAAREFKGPWNIENGGKPATCRAPGAAAATTASGRGAASCPLHH